ncbi:helix-turn-helix domain-containing protein [Mucilaginibacter aquaedulcis]|uniref:helix-turn-helix domain-containing protein n=1 Tax=Mucilaginibacter aquaedulcis TaxID=1187081 RepID=UPI0025B4AD51|nr:helix-turn-helix domain-containing protein [Mucilaginibacter aquaedulcis]MDN3547299.1 helix-turn-helix domain-containing protein [Mucilaginibacter aquaedulcis]
MKNKETAAAFFERHGRSYAEVGQFNVFRIEDFNNAGSFPHIRRDFYKIMLLTKAKGKITYADKTIDITDNALIFGNPMIPYSWDGPKENITGYFCLFTEEFLNVRMKSEGIAESVLFRAGGYPVVYPDQKTVDLLSVIFNQMLSEIQTAYIHKYDLLRNYIQVIIHESLKISPSNEFYKPGTSLARISTLFLELLERQFPISSTGQLLKFKSPGEYARQLSTHTNHLNKALRETTGKTTSQHLTERIVAEAKALLINSGWPVSAIGYCLGFEHASNFNIFFKKQAGITPNDYRHSMI